MCDQKGKKTMSDKTLLKHLLNVKNTIVDSYEIIDQNLIISVHPTKGKQCICPICHRKARYYDSLGFRKWRSLDMDTTKVFISAKINRVNCKKHGTHTSEVPWARHHSNFTRDFENTVAWMTKYLSKTAVSSYMRISWNTIGPIISRYRKDADPYPEQRFNNLRRIGIDETSYRKGHKYMTVIVNHDTNSVIWVHDKHGKDVLREFFSSLSSQQKSSIECVTADGARWISEILEEYIPHAQRCLDSYHLVEWAQNALDQVRVEACHRAKPYDEKRGRGRPRKGEDISKVSCKIKHTKFLLGKSYENLTESQLMQLNYIACTDSKLYRAYTLKEYLRKLIKLPSGQIELALHDWLWKASHSRIPSIYELSKKVRRHKDAILNTAKYHLSNARIEAMNNKIKLSIRMAYGFRNIENMFDMIYLKCSNIPTPLPWIQPGTMC